ncbi:MULTISPECIES: hypothetical protein [unclassified Pantoea]|uniref:hypothetical protein n=1 Tax=unclassified Pantoea TaxID=2630326 RepID=UPI002117A1F7|nr:MULTISPECIES: hypothetical protein [unclassified Pantoea]
MSVIIDNEDDGVTASVPAKRDIDNSIQLYQQIYQHITGTTEKTKHRCADNLLIDLDEIKQVHHKIEQISSTHNVISKNVSITVLHSHDRKEQFTSFDRFLLSTGISTSPTLSVIIKYNFAILPVSRQLSPAMDVPNHYEVTVKLNSKIALQKEMEDDAPPFMRGKFITFMITNAAEVTVEYADYIIARGFVEAFKEWTDGCKRVSSKVPLIQRLQFISHFIPSAIKFIFTVLILFYTYQSISLYVSESSTIETISRFMIISFGAFFIIPSIARSFGGNIERAIDNYVAPSYVILNKGDERLYEEYKDRNRKSLVKSAINILITIMLGIVSSRLDKLF